MNVLTVNLLFSTLVFWIAAKLYVLPRLPHLRPQTVLVPIFLLHSLRHLGHVSRSRGDVCRPRKTVCLPGSIRRFAGTVDLASAITLAQIYRAADLMGAAYWIPAFWVPALLVTHYITFVVLIKHWKGTFLVPAE